MDHCQHLGAPPPPSYATVDGCSFFSFSITHSIICIESMYHIEFSSLSLSSLTHTHTHTHTNRPNHTHTHPHTQPLWWNLPKRTKFNNQFSKCAKNIKFVFRGSRSARSSISSIGNFFMLVQSSWKSFFSVQLEFMFSVILDLFPCFCSMCSR
jgi:hypothetical protein